MSKCEEANLSIQACGKDIVDVSFIVLVFHFIRFYNHRYFRKLWYRVFKLWKLSDIVDNYLIYFWNTAWFINVAYALAYWVSYWVKLMDNEFLKMNSEEVHKPGTR